MKILIAYVSGVLFSVGLIVGGMTQPAKIVGFLDVAGGWDPSLALVMAGALIVYGVAVRYSKRRARPFFEKKFYLPTASDVDWRLVSGSAIFGVGWGLGGYCPGPGITALGSGKLPVLLFVVGMGVGTYLYRWADVSLFQPREHPQTERPAGVRSDG